MEEVVSDSIYMGSAGDEILATLIDITIASIREERPIFPNLLDEPVLYRYFRTYVKKALDGQRRIDGEDDLVTGE